MKIKLTTLCLITAFFMCFLLPASSYSQLYKASTDTSLCFVRKDLKIEHFLSKSELEKLPKLQLINIYKSRLEYLIEVLPFLSLHPKPGSTFYDMAIPETEENVSHLEKEMVNKKEFVGSLFETLDDVVPYSEKENLIWCILFFDEMIKKSDYSK